MNRPDKILHIVSSLDAVNFGIWNAAFFGSGYLTKKYNLHSAAWICRERQPEDPAPGIPVTYLGSDFSGSDLKALAARQGLDPKATVVVSHGCWLAPSRAGHALLRLGFAWIHVPHGMLEPWSLRQGRLKKMAYFMLREKRYLMSATSVRAVSRSEKNNLVRKLARKIDLVENGVRVPHDQPGGKTDGTVTFLFMARLHHKKGILPLVRAWRRAMGSVSGKQLIIAGPDEGEAEKIKPLLAENAKYIGPVYGAEKEDWLRKADYYLLPSFSEGFPTSVLEAMSYGLVPLVSEGCNFPQVFAEELGYRAEPDEEQLMELLSRLRDEPYDAALSQRNRAYIIEHYAENVIGEELYKLYISLQKG